MNVQIITPDSKAYAGDALSVTIPTTSGEITVLAHHAPLVSTLAPGTLIVRDGSGDHLFAVARGMVEVDGTSVRILTDIADPAEHLQEEAIVRAKAEAEKLISERRTDTQEFTEAMAVLDRETARLISVRRHRSHARTPHLGDNA